MIILSLKFRINLVFYFIKELKNKNTFSNFCYEVEDKIGFKVKMNSIFKENPMIKNEQSS